MPTKLAKLQAENKSLLTRLGAALGLIKSFDAKAPKKEGEDDEDTQNAETEDEDDEHRQEGGDEDDDEDTAQEGETDDETDREEDGEDEDDLTDKEKKKAASLPPQKAVKYVTDCFKAKIGAVRADGNKRVKAVSTERDAYKAAVEDGGLFAFSNPAGGKPTLALTEKGEAKFVNKKSARTLAQSGHRSLNAPVDTPAPGNKTDAKTGVGRTKQTWSKPF